MKLLSLFPAALGLIYISLAAAQECANVALTVIPGCAQNCILNGAPTIGCEGTDFDCQCAQSAALFAAVEGCVATACPSASYQAVIDGASTVCDCASPALRAGAVAGTASVSYIGGTATAPASNSATVTSAKATTTTKTTAGSVTSAAGSVTTPSPGSGNTWTGYTSVSNVATASVVGAAAQATPAANVIRYIVPVVMAGAAFL